MWGGWAGTGRHKQVLTGEMGGWAEGLPATAKAALGFRSRFVRGATGA